MAKVNEKYWQNKANEVCKMYGVPNTPVIFSNRLKSANGTYSYKWEDTKKFRAAKTLDEINSAITAHKITISNHIAEHFTDKEINETLLHELAHHIMVFTQKDISHSYRFKELCCKLGGTMNPQMAGTSFAASASNNYVSNKVGIKYECICGRPNHGIVHYVRSPRRDTLMKYSCPACKRLMKFWKVTEK